MPTPQHLLRNFASLLPVSRLDLSRPTILAFHGVEDHVVDERIQVAQHETGVFVQTMELLKSRFEVLPLTYLPDALAQPFRFRRSVFLTFDDGYTNLQATVAPILKQMNLPWALFVSTGHIGDSGRHPLYLFRQFVFYAPEGSYAVPVLGRRVSLKGRGSRNSLAASLLPAFARLPFDLAMECIDGMRAQIPIEVWATVPNFESESFLTYEQIRNLRGNGVEIGSHAHWHWSMGAQSSDDFLRLQTSLSKELIEKHIGPCRYFSYPYGQMADLCARARKFVLEAGYDAAFTTLAGSLLPDQDKWLLPRYVVGRADARLDNLVPFLRLRDRSVRRRQNALIGLP